ncbi:MAG: hypothetical protein NZ933_00715 [Bacteroidia bacterium]|nr:hypothetical protein [Bacteroidia bacterium]
MPWLLGFLLTLLWAQSPLPYTSLHRKLIPLVDDTTHRGWLSRLREVMEEERHIEWNERFFQEIIQLYLQQSDSLPVLMSTLQRYVKLDSLSLSRLFTPLSDKKIDAAVLMDYFRSTYRAYERDTSQAGYVLRQLLLLGQDACQTWLMVPKPPPLGLVTAAAMRGYLKGLAAAYAFFGFDASSEPWQQKMQIIEAVGVLEYYAYGESANAYRAWKRGLVP